MPKKKFPKTLYVVIEAEGDPEEWMNCSENPQDISKHGESVRAGVYQLVEEKQIVNSTQVVARKK